ncbi:MAG: hypothetical protein RL684_848 [Pseudomonadota bacterium]|jgi:hypothetical protein
MEIQDGLLVGPVDVLEGVQLLSIAADADQRSHGWASLYRVRYDDREFDVFGVGTVYAAEVVGDLGVLSLWDVKAGKPLFRFDSYQRGEAELVVAAMTWWAALPIDKQRQVERRAMNSGRVGRIVDAYRRVNP